MVGAFVVGIVLPARLALAVVGALFLPRAVPVTPRCGRAHVAPVIALTRCAALIGRVAPRVALGLCLTAIVWSAPATTTSFVVAGVATVVAWSRSALEVARRSTRAMLLVTREVASAAASRIRSTAWLEAVVRAWSVTRLVA
jgi:hypothetical protein